MRIEPLDRCRTGSTELFAAKSVSGSLHYDQFGSHVTSLKRLQNALAIVERDPAIFVAVN